MIENFSKEELKVIIEELKSVGYQMDQQAKCTIFDDCVREKLGIEVNVHGKHSPVTKKLKTLFIEIADLMTDNFTNKWANYKEGKYAHAVRNKFVPNDKADAYKSVMSSMLDVIKPYFDDAVKGYEERYNEIEKMREEHLVEKYGR